MLVGKSERRSRRRIISSDKAISGETFRYRDRLPAIRLSTTILLFMTFVNWLLLVLMLFLLLNKDNARDVVLT